MDVLFKFSMIIIGLCKKSEAHKRKYLIYHGFN